MQYPDIRLLVPHTGQMVLLDKILEIDNETLTAEVTIKTDNIFFNGTGVNTWVGIEYMAQAIAAYAGYKAYLNNQPIKVGFLLGTRHYKTDRAIFALASQLKIQVKHIFQADNGLGSFECNIIENNEKAASAVITVFQPENLEDFLEQSA